MNKTIFRLMRTYSAVRSFLRDRLLAEKGAADTVPAKEQQDNSHEPYAVSVLLNPEGTPKGKPYKRQERVRKICVSEIAEACRLFSSLGDRSTGFVQDSGGFGMCAIDDTANGLHFRMLVKPLRYPLHTVATLTITCDEGFSFPVDTVYFIRDTPK